MDAGFDSFHSLLFELSIFLFIYEEIIFAEGLGIAVMLEDHLDDVIFCGGCFVGEVCFCYLFWVMWLGWSREGCFVEGGAC